VKALPLHAVTDQTGVTVYPKGGPAGFAGSNGFPKTLVEAHAILLVNAKKPANLQTVKAICKRNATNESSPSHESTTARNC
jgi:hypothetical protein